MAKKTEVKGHDLKIRQGENSKSKAPNITIEGSDIDFSARPEKITELLKVLEIADDVTIEVKVSTASVIVE